MPISVENHLQLIKFDAAAAFIRSVCLPFAKPSEYPQVDWHHRITILTEFIDYLSLKISETPAFAYYVGTMKDSTPYKSMDELRNLVTSAYSDFEVNTSTRASVLMDLNKYESLIDYKNVLKSSIDERKMIEMFSDIPSVEKFAISCCSLAICKFEMPMATILEFCNIIRDECLHLLAFSRMLNVDPLEGGWITNYSLPNWKQINKCDNCVEHILLEHCLFEGEGALSSNYALYQANSADFPDVIKSVIGRVAVEELRHVTTGYYLANFFSCTQLQRKNCTKTALSLLRETEPLMDLGGNRPVKAYKQRFAEAKIKEWSQTGNWLKVIHDYFDASQEYANGNYYLKKYSHNTIRV